jgi:hypothetical protein
LNGAVDKPTLEGIEAQAKAKAASAPGAPAPTPPPPANRPRGLNDLARDINNGDVKEGQIDERLDKMNGVLNFADNDPEDLQRHIIKHNCDALRQKLDKSEPLTSDEQAVAQRYLDANLAAGGGYETSQTYGYSFGKFQQAAAKAGMKPTPPPPNTPN